MPARLLLALAGAAAAASAAEGGWRPRRVQVRDGRFVNAETGAWEHLLGTNVVVKGPPWLPAVNGSARCGGEHAPCTSFSAHDARWLRSQGMNIIRLGVVWAGGQPTPAPALDAAWLARLHAILELCDAHGIRVILDVHQDAMGTASCGEGVPMWLSQRWFPHLIGKPLLGPDSRLSGECSLTDWESWAAHAGDPLYNVLNKCCVRWNRPGPTWGKALLAQSLTQLTIHRLIGTAEGREAYARYVGLLARAVAGHPAAIGIELMNEPPNAPLLESGALFRLYRACYDEVRALGAADLALGVANTGSEALYASDGFLPADVRAWLRNASGLFYAFHAYVSPALAPFIVDRAVKLGKLWRAPPFVTELQDAAVQAVATARGVGSTVYQYNRYCSTPRTECDPRDACAFGACIT
jgi:hypothetical protein